MSCAVDSLPADEIPWFYLSESRYYELVRVWWLDLRHVGMSYVAAPFLQRGMLPLPHGLDGRRGDNNLYERNSAARSLCIFMRRMCVCLACRAPRYMAWLVLSTTCLPMLLLDTTVLRD